MHTYKHLFFDMDKTITPPRQMMLPDMYQLLSNLSQDVVVVSGSSLEQMPKQISDLRAYRLGQNGNHALAADGSILWFNPELTAEHKTEIIDHISEISELLEHTPNPDWNPIEDRGAQITFSPIGNTAPVDIKMQYDPDREKRFSMLKQIPFASKELMVVIGGSTSLDYLHNERHKGANVTRLIETKGWNKEECVYFGDGLYPGGNDELVIGIIDTIAVDDHLDCYQKLQTLLTQQSGSNQ